MSIDLTGQRFGRLVVDVEGAGRGIGRDRKATWICRCDCGAVIERLAHLLRSGKTRSCGCLRVETTRVRRMTHGAQAFGRKAPPEYIAWAGMIDRCERSTSRAFQYYGARGIRVCDRWRHDFAAFLADMGPRPTDGHSIDRIDVNGDYSPENCRWATDAEQARNTRRNLWIEWNGTRMIGADFARLLGVRPWAVYEAIERGDSPAEIARRFAARRAS